MPLREKAYFGLEEIQTRLGLKRRDLTYLLENGLLKASVRVWDAVIEEGEYDRAADGQTFRLPTDQRRFSGLLDLRPKDAYRLFRDQTTVINAFDAPEGEYLVVLRPEDGIEVRLTLVLPGVARRNSRVRPSSRCTTPSTRSRRRSTTAKAMIAEHRIELKQIKGEVETIRTTVTSHVAKEDVLFHMLQKVLGLGIAIGGTLTATLLAVIAWLLTHQNPWINP